MAVKYFAKDCDLKLRGKRRISMWITATIVEEGYRIGQVNYIFCSPEEHQVINRQYLGHDWDTDVITFDNREDGDKKKIISGDIFVNPEIVAQNAAQYKTDPDEELHRVMIHGVLHLCGYNDASPEERSTMRGREDHYLTKLAQMI